MNTTNTQNFTNQTTGGDIGATFAFESISTPGAYICNWSGHLLRVPEDGVTPGRSPVLNLIGAAPLTVTKISENPYITLTKAKLVASNFDLSVNF